MNDYWRTKYGTRWNAETRIRASRLFRHHVRTKSNPRGRIARMACAFADHPRHRDECRSPLLPNAEFAHLDYSRPFYGTWACEIAHRRLERGSLKITKRRIFDYEALVAPVVRPGARRETRGAQSAAPRQPAADVPF